MKFNSRANVNSYIKAGSSSGNSSAALVRDIKAAAPDYAMLVKKLDDIQSAKRQAEMQKLKVIGDAKLRANVITEKQKYASDLQAAKDEYNLDTRMAGYLGALGTNVAGSLAKNLIKKPEKPAPVQMDIDGLINQINSDSSYIDDWKKMAGVYGPDGKPVLAYIKDGKIIDPSISGQQTDGSPQVSTPSAAAPAPQAPAQSMSFAPQAATGPIPAGIPTKEQLLPPMTTEQVNEVFLQAGATPTQARIFSTGIVPAESANIPNNNTITSGLVNDAGETSFGIAQINMFGEDPVENARRKALFGITNETELFDPLTNAKAALKLLAEQGYGAWSTYNPATMY